MNTHKASMPPLVSVVIPAYNCERYIQKAIDSIINQTYQNLEIVIADDGSRDNTKALIEEYTDPRIKRFHDAENLGNIRTRNKLFEVATGDFITIQDADDWSDPERIEKQVCTLVTSPDLGACGTNYYQVNLRGDKNKTNNLTEDIVVSSATELQLWPPSIMIRKEVYRKIGGLNLYFERLFAEDKYWINLILEKYKVLCLKEPLYYYRFNPDSLTKKLDQPRKLLLHSVIDELLRQRKESGTDWLEQQNYEKLQAFEASLFLDKRWLSEQYRIFSAVSIDSLKFKEAVRLLTKAVFLFPFKSIHIRTATYLIKQYVTNITFRTKFRY